MRIPHKNSVMNGWFVIDGCRQVKGGSVGGVLLFSRFGIRQNPIPVNESDLFFFHHEEHEGIREEKMNLVLQLHKKLIFLRFFIRYHLWLVFKVVLYMSFMVNLRSAMFPGRCPRLVCHGPSCLRHMRPPRRL